MDSKTNIWFEIGKLLNFELHEYEMRNLRGIRIPAKNQIFFTQLCDST